MAGSKALSEALADAPPSRVAKRTIGAVLSRVLFFMDLLIAVQKWREGKRLVGGIWAGEKGKLESVVAFLVRSGDKSAQRAVACGVVDEGRLEGSSWYLFVGPLPCALPSDSVCDRPSSGRCNDGLLASWLSPSFSCAGFFSGSFGILARLASASRLASMVLGRSGCHSTHDRYPRARSRRGCRRGGVLSLVAAHDFRWCGDDPSSLFKSQALRLLCSRAFSLKQL